MDSVKRNFSDRRSGKDRRKILSLRRLRYKGPERRVLRNRRSKIERRDGWVKIGKWSSVKMQDLKIARYLHWKLSFLNIRPPNLPSTILDADPIWANWLLIIQWSTPLDNTVVNFRSGSEWWFVKADVEFITRLKTIFRLKVHAVTGYVAQLGIAIKPSLFIGEHYGTSMIKSIMLPAFKTFQHSYFLFTSQQR